MNYAFKISAREGIFICRYFDVSAAAGEAAGGARVATLFEL